MSNLTLINNTVNEYFKNMSNDNAILEQFGLLSIFNSLNENIDSSTGNSQQIKEIQHETATALNTISKTNKNFAQKLANAAKNVFKKHGQSAFLTVCVILNLLSGNPSASLWRSLERKNFKLDKPSIEMLKTNMDIDGGGEQYIEDAINKFVLYNFGNYNSFDQNKIKNYIVDQFKLKNDNVSFKFIVISNNYKFLKDAMEEIRNRETDNIKLLNSFKNKDKNNPAGKYQVLGIYGIINA